MVRSRQHGDPRLGAAIFLILGVFSLVIGVVFFITTRRNRNRCSNVVSATVVDNVFEHSSIGSGRTKSSVATYYPVFEFDFKRKKVRAKGEVGSNPPEHKVGDVVEIRVNPENPQEIVAGSGKLEIIISAFLFFIGVLFSTIGGFLAASVF